MRFSAGGCGITCRRFPRALGSMPPVSSRRSGARSPTWPWVGVFTSIRGSPAVRVGIAAWASRCSAAAFQGYFGFFPHSIRQLLDYPFGGFSEYITASPQRLVHLPPQVTFEQAARFGYLGTSYAALRLGRVRGGSWVAINGITGSLGVGTPLLALAWGARSIHGFGRN